MFCREAAAQLREILPELRKGGADLYVIGSGTPEQAKHFMERSKLDAKAFVSQDLRAYEAAKLRRSFLSVVNPSLVKNFFRARVGGGFKQGRTQGDTWQQGGVVVVAPGGKVLFHHADNAAGDPVPLD